MHNKKRLLMLRKQLFALSQMRILVILTPIGFSLHISLLVSLHRKIHRRVCICSEIAQN